jgi:hypothetical protein
MHGENFDAEHDCRVCESTVMTGWLFVLDAGGWFMTCRRHVFDAAESLCTRGQEYRLQPVRA